MAGMGEASGLRERNKCTLSRDNASAEVFSDPGIWRALNDMSNTATRKASVRSKCDKEGSRAEPLLTAANTALLSHKHTTLFPAQ